MIPMAMFLYKNHNVSHIYKIKYLPGSGVVGPTGSIGVVVPGSSVVGVAVVGTVVVVTFIIVAGGAGGNGGGGFRVIIKKLLY